MHLKIRSKQDQVCYPVSVGEAAALCGVSPQQMRVYEIKGLIKPYRFGRRKNRLFLEEDVVAVLRYRAERAKQRKKLKAKDALNYLSKLPAAIPVGMVLVHNNVRPTRKLGSRGFRAWLSAPDEVKLEKCRCSLSVGPHFKVRAKA